VQVVEQHDGTRLALRKLDADYDVHDRSPHGVLQTARRQGQVVTGCSTSMLRPKIARPPRTRWTRR